MSPRSPSLLEQSGKYSPQMKDQLLVSSAKQEFVVLESITIPHDVRRHKKPVFLNVLICFVCVACFCSVGLLNTLLRV